MNITKQAISCKRSPINLFANENFNNDFILPDYYPDISKIINCTYTTETETKSFEDNKIIFSGNLRINLLYECSEHVLHCYQNCIKFVKTVVAEGVDKNTCCRISGEIISQSCRALGPKRFNVNGTIGFKISYDKVVTTEVIRNIEDMRIQCKSRELSYFRITHQSDKNLKIKERYTPDSEIKFSDIIRKECHINVNEKRTIKDKTYLSGHFTTEILYKDEDNSIKKLRFDTQFSEVIATDGSKDNDDCYLINYMNCADIAIVKNEKGSDFLDISISSDFCLICAKREDAELVEDMYSLDGKIDVIKYDMDVLENISFGNNVVKFSCTTKSEYKNIEIIDYYLKDTRLSSELSENSSKIILEGKISILGKTDDGYCIFEENIIQDLTEIGKENEVLVDQNNIRVLSCNTLRTAADETEIFGEITVNITGFIKCKVSCFTEIKECEAKKYCNDTKIVLCYIQEDEDIWSIAKNNRTTVESIKTINDITDDFVHAGSSILFTVF